MNFPKTSFLKYNGLYFNLLLSLSFAILLLFLRMKLTHSHFYVFLVWNLFLAGIPFLITQGLKLKQKTTKLTFFLGFTSWLLFLPNSAYIITDLVHLHNENSNLIWLDLFLVFVFALNGLLLGLLSIMDMFSMLKTRFNQKVATYTIFKVCLLSGYGIYLGRFLRFNSWDILAKPKTLFLDIVHSVSEPKAWLMIFAFGGFQWVLFTLMKSVANEKKY
ncbi:MAG: hypothetical protein COA50_07305 [Flavobacteriaceae bacterium]|nr:MAG: hypothetical protein COA50_07305 [Flavobacteriaceae bacterium]